MVSTAEHGMREQNELEGMLRDAARRLSPAHVAVLVAHPEAVRSALAAAADVLSASDRRRRSEVETIAGRATPAIRAAEANRRLDARTRSGASETLLTSQELAALTGRTRQTLHDWRRKGRVIGWQKARRDYLFPAEQLDGRKRPMAGLDRVAGLFGDGYAAWVWLTTPRPSLDGAVPLALLAQGEVERVADAAKGDRQGDFA